MLMRKINKIILHHSATQRDLDFKRSLNSFNNSHKVRLYEKYKQPRSGTEYPYIAYHYCIGGKGELEQTRKHENIGYHASNITVNNESIGICLLGNFDEEYPSEEQYSKLREILGYLKEQYPEATIHLHNEFSSKTCPGVNFDLNKITMTPLQKNALEMIILANKVLYEAGNEEMKKLAHKHNNELRELLNDREQ